MSKELKKVTKKAKTAKVAKSTKPAKAIKATKTTKPAKETKSSKKELSAKDRKKVTGGKYKVKDALDLVLSTTRKGGKVAGVPTSTIHLTMDEAIKYYESLGYKGEKARAYAEEAILQKCEPGYLQKYN